METRVISKKNNIEYYGNKKNGESIKKKKL